MTIARVYFKDTKAMYDLDDIAFKGDKKKFLEMITLLTDVNSITKIEFWAVENND